MPGKLGIASNMPAVRCQPAGRTAHRLRGTAGRYERRPGEGRHGADREQRERRGPQGHREPDEGPEIVHG
eukprot:6884497-Lingulodinium_polyedra.AAC.1